MTAKKRDSTVELTATFEAWQIAEALKAYYKLPEDATVDFRLKDQHDNDPRGGSSWKVFGNAVVKFKKKLGEVL